MFPRVLVLVLVCLGCPPVVSSECASCASDAECAPQGLRCVRGVCQGAVACSDVADGGTSGGATSATGGGVSGGRVSGGGVSGGGVSAGGVAGGSAGGLTAGGASGGSSGGASGGATPGILPPLGFVRDASVILEDDFDGPFLRDAGGKWKRVSRDTTPGQTLGLEADAGVTGGALVLVDVDNNGGAQNGRFAWTDFPAVNGDVYVRAQVWMTENGIIGPHIIVMYTDQTPSTVAAEFNIRDGVVLKADQRNGVDDYRALPSPWVSGTWQVVDLVLLQTGSSQGVGVLRVGNEQVRLARDWSTVQLTSVGLGAAAMEPAWVGTLRLDNFAVTAGGPAPARLQLVPSSPLVANVCAPVRIELRDSFDGGLARAVRPVRVGFDGGAVYAAGCQGAPLAEAVVPRGAPALELGLRVPPGPVNLVAIDRGADLSSTTVSWQAVP